MSDEFKRKMDEAAEAYRAKVSAGQSFEQKWSTIVSNVIRPVFQVAVEVHQKNGVDIRQGIDDIDGSVSLSIFNNGGAAGDGLTYTPQVDQSSIEMTMRVHGQPAAKHRTHADHFSSGLIEGHVTQFVAASLGITLPEDSSSQVLRRH
jgi:hypothetical protein